jgi:hypothetical protein
MTLRQVLKQETIKTLQLVASFEFRKAVCSIVFVVALYKLEKCNSKEEGEGNSPGLAPHVGLLHAREKVELSSPKKLFCSVQCLCLVDILCHGASRFVLCVSTSVSAERHTVC